MSLLASRLIGAETGTVTCVLAVMAGKAPQLEEFIWEHNVGKPHDRVEQTGKMQVTWLQHST